MDIFSDEFMDQFHHEIKELVKDTIREELGGMKQTFMALMEPMATFINHFPEQLKTQIEHYRPAIEYLKQLDESYDLNKLNREELERDLNITKTRFGFYEDKVARLQKKLYDMAQKLPNQVKME